MFMSQVVGEMSIMISVKSKSRVVIRLFGYANNVANSR